MKHRKGRSLLNSLGIVLGVAILFGVLVSNASTTEGFKALIEDFTGRADVLVTPTGSFEAAMPESTVERITALPDVKIAVGKHLLPSSIKPSHLKEPEGVFINGIDPEEEKKINNLNLLRGRFAGAGAEAVISQKLSKKAKAGIGDDLSFATAAGNKKLRIVGILDDTGAARAFEGRGVFTSVKTARELDSKGEVFRLISVVLKEDVAAENWIKTNKGKLTGLDVEDASALGNQFITVLKGIQTGFTSFAGISLFVGAFVIYLSLTTSIVERTRMLGTLRSLGTTKWQIIRMVLREAAILGLVSSLVGLVVGFAVARVLLALVARLFEIELSSLVAPPSAFITAVGVGMIVTLVSALIPARRAARLSPVAAIRGPGPEASKISKVWIAGIVLLAGGIAMSASTDARLSALANLLILLGAVFLTPLLLRPASALLGYITRRISKGGGDIAVLHLVKERSRSGYTLALIMVVMAMVFTNGAVKVSISNAIGGLLDRIYGSDLIVDARGSQFLPEIQGEIEAVRGVGKVTPVSLSSTFIKKTAEKNEEPTLVLLIDPSSYFELESLDLQDISRSEAKAALATADTVLLTTSMSEDTGRKTGDMINLKTLEGQQDFRVGGVFKGIFGPNIVMSIANGGKYLGASKPGEFHLNVEEGSTVASVRKGIEKKLGSRYNLEFQTLAEVKDEAEGQLSRFTQIFLAILLVAAIIGLLGLANTMAISVTQRSRETGVLRAVGSTRSQVARAVLAESLTLGLTAFVLSIPLGWALSRGAVGQMSKVLEFDLGVAFPAGWVWGLALFGIVASTLAALAPARKAARAPVVESLRFE